MQQVTQLFLRIAAGFSFFFYGSDRLGLWGKYGDPNVSWGDWQHFMEYASKVMGFLPYSIAQVFAVIATTGEIIFGLMLIIGFKLRFAALCSAVLALLFAISMTISFGVFKPLAYSVYTVSAACFLLSTLEDYDYSLDKILKKPADKT